MIKLHTSENVELIKWLESTKGQIPNNEYVICITQSNETPIIGIRPNVLPIVFDNELFGHQILSFNDAFRIFNFVKYKIKPQIKKMPEVFLHITCTDGVTQSGALADWVAEYLEKDLLDTEYYEKRNLFIEPSVTTLNKMYLIQALNEDMLEPKQYLPKVAIDLINSTNPVLTTELKQDAMNYLHNLFSVETALLKR